MPHSAAFAADSDRTPPRGRAGSRLPPDAPAEANRRREARRVVPPGSVSGGLCRDRVCRDVATDTARGAAARSTVLADANGRAGPLRPRNRPCTGTGRQRHRARRALRIRQPHFSASARVPAGGPAPPAAARRPMARTRPTRRHRHAAASWFLGRLGQGDTDVWFGLNGGFSGGLGGLGGLVRFNRKTGRVESVWTDELLQAPVTGLAVSDDALWVGTTKGGYGQPGRVGLLRYDLKTSTWRRYTAENSALPGNLISVIAADGDRLWVATENGIGALDTRTSAWTVWSFALGLDGDTVVHELVEGRRPPDDVRAGIFALMLRLQVTAREPFLRACLGVATDRFAALTRSEDRADTLAIAALAQPPLVPFLVTALGRTGEPRYLAASALGRLRDPQLIPTLRAALDSSAPAGTGAVATALGLLGDSAGYRWMRSHLYVGGGWNVLEFVRAAARLRDRGSISQLATLLRIGPRGDAYAALAAIGTPEAWRTIAKEVAYPAEKR